MKSEHWQQVDKIFADVLEREGADREAFLREACAGDPKLRQVVENLLAADEKAKSLLEKPALDVTAQELAQDQGVRVGQTIGTYKIISLLGRGGMGEVYLAEDTTLKRQVAIKVLPESLARDPQHLARFRREAKLLAALNHPNIATIHGLEESQKYSFLVMELVEGEDLSERLKRGPLSWEEVLKVALQLAEGLEAAHKKGIIHRDLKPANIKLTPERKIKILDFGLAKAFDWDTPVAEGAEELTRSGVILGTTAYMSPEQAMGKPLDERTDIFSFACVLYELLTGKRAFGGESVAEILGGIIHEEPDLDALPERTPPIARLLLKRCLQKDRSRRQQHMADARIEMEEALTKPDTVAPAASCPKCRHANPPGHRFCGSCGSALENLCLQCGAMLGPNAAFCGSCGQALDAESSETSAAAAPPTTMTGTTSPLAELALTNSERRYATVVHATIEGYVMLAEQMEGDELERLMDRIQTGAAQIVAKHEGVLNRVDVEELVAIFGVPVAHEDDARRGVNAVLELQQYVEAISADVQKVTGSPIGVRSGIGTGFVVVRESRREGQRFALAGDAVRLASRLAVHAGVDDVLVGSETERLLAPFFDTETLESIAVGGAAIKPYRVVGASAVRSRFQASERGSLTRFAGRDTEMGLLQTCLEQALTGEGQVVSIVGEAGVGKSRLRYEFTRTLNPKEVRVVEGRCQSMGEMTPYWPFVEALRNLLGLEKEVEQQADAVVEGVRALDPGLENFVPLYLHLLSIQSEEPEASHQLKGENLRLAMLESLAAVFTLASQQRTIVMLLEDWHWADEGSQEMLSQLAGIVTSYPLLVVVTARPQGAPDLKHVDQHKVIGLGPLAESSSSAIMSSVLDVEGVAKDLSKHLHERTSGNPFFLEELCRAMREEGVITVVSGQAVLTGKLESLQLPNTVQGVLRSRLDRVDPDAREVLRLASVVGREFGKDTLERALPESISLVGSLETLKSLGMIQQTYILPKPQYRFKHALTQEAAYESLVQHQRKTLHGLVGKVLEELYPDRVDEQPDVFAHHFSLAEQWEEAVAYGRRAADKASELTRFGDAARMLQSVHHWVSKLEDTPKRLATEIDVLLEWERACETVGQRDQQSKIIDMLLAQIEPGVDDHKLAETYIRQGDLCTLLGEYDGALEALNVSLALWRGLTDRVGERNALRSLGFLGWSLGDFESAIAAAEEALAIDRRRQDSQAVAQDLNNLGMVLRAANRIDEALGYFEEAVQMYEQGKAEVEGHHALVSSAAIYRDQGDFDRALDYLKKARELERRHRLIAQESFTMVGLAAIAQAQCKPEEAIRLYKELVQRAREAQYATGLGQGLHGLVELLLTLDRPGDARLYAQESAEVFHRMSERSHEAAARQRLAEICEQLHDYPAAAAEWHQARALCKAIGNSAGELVAIEGVARLARQTENDVQAVMAHYQDALDLAIALDNDAKQGDLLNSLGVVHWQQGDYAESLRCYQRALQIFRDQEDQPHVGLMLNSIGAVLRDAGRLEEALPPLQEALEINRKSNQKRLEGHSLATLGDVYAAIGKPSEALAQYQASLELRRALEDRSGEGWMLFRIAESEASLDQWDGALDFVGQARRIADEVGDKRLQTACDQLSH